MDLIVYCLFIGLVGLIRVNSTKSVPQSAGITDMGMTSTIDCELPVASNLALNIEYGAYTLILEELGLKTHA